MEVVWLYIRITVKISDLTVSMYTGIRSTRAVKNDAVVGHDPEGLFDFSLDGGIFLLALPAMVPGTVVFNDDLEIFKHLVKTQTLYE